MDYEKAYKASLKTAAQWIKDGCTDKEKICLKCVFLELRESEDERIRKWLLECVENLSDGNFIEVSRQDVLFYLEKQKDSKVCEEKSKNFTIQKEQKPNIELIQRSWYMEGYHDREFGKEPKWIIKTGEGGPRHEPNPRYGQPLAKEQNPAEWKPQPESLEALMYAIEGKWNMIPPTSYLSRRLEDLYEGLVNTFNVNETLLAELPKTAYTAEDIEELRELKHKIEASMEQKPAEWSEEAEMYLSQAIETLEHENHLILADKLKSLRPVKPAEGKEYSSPECGTTAGVWSEEDGPFDEDEFLEDELSAFLQNYDKEYDDDAAVSDVAKHFYEIGKKQKEQKPIQTSEEKEYIRTLKSLISDFIRDKQPEDVIYYQRVYDWLDGRHIEQKPAEWSEDDERILKGIIGKIDHDQTYGVSKAEMLSFLKSLRPSWKPSEEQMEALLWCVAHLGGADHRLLAELYEHLKMLM